MACRRVDQVSWREELIEFSAASSADAALPLEKFLSDIIEHNNSPQKSHVRMRIYAVLTLSDGSHRHSGRHSRGHSFLELCSLRLSNFSPQARFHTYI